MSANFDLPFELSNLAPLQNTFPTTTFSVVPITRNLEGKNIAAPIQLDPLGHDQYLPVPNISSLDLIENTSLISADNQQSTVINTSDQITGFISDIPFLNSDALANINKKELVFIDSNVTDYQSLIAGVKPSAEVILLKGDRDGISQITDALKGRSGITSIQILSHGNSGEIQLGNSSLSQSNLDSYADQLQSWSSALSSDADILLFGCDIASGETGDNFIHQISSLTGADVTASTNLTGNSALGGDWVLEDRTGAIEADFAISAASQAAYSSVLLTPVTQLNFSSGLVLSSFVAGATTFNAAGILDAVVLRRVDNSVTNDGSTSDASVLQRNIVWIQDPVLPAPGLTEEFALLGNDLSFGTDNLFKNDSTSPEQNTNNIERVDVISNGGIVAPSSGLGNIGFLIVDRGSGGGGANDPFQIAGITSDPTMTAATAFTYGTTPIAVTMADYGVTGTSLNYNIFNDMDGMGVYVDNTGNGGMPLTQALNAVFVSFEELGIMPGQTFYGFSLAATDAGTNLSDFTTFPTNTNDATGGLDLAATGGVFFIGNLPPTAVADTATTSGTPATIGVLTNDTDPNGDPLTITGTTDGMNGMVTTDPGPTSSPTDDVVIYTPNASFTGTDSFTYTISDGNGGLDTATVTVTVNNGIPDAVNDSTTTASGTPVSISVLTNDTDPNGDPLTITAAAAGMNGTTSINTNGTTSPTDDVVVYTPNTGFTGTDSFTYTISDGNGGLDTATVTVTVNNGIPDAVNDSTTTASGTPVSISVLTNDTDPNGDPLTITAANPGMNGSTSINTNGTTSPTDDVVVYTPNTGFVGTDSFTYTISDGNGGLDTATVSVVVGPGVNQPPIAGDDRSSTMVDTPVSIMVLTNDMDPNPGDTITITDLGTPANGMIVIDPGPTTSSTDDVIVYTPNSSFMGTDSFTYTISDGMGGFDTATVTVAVGLPIGGGGGIGGGGIDPTPTPTPTPRPSEFPPLPTGGGGGGSGGGGDNPSPSQQNFVGLDTLDILNLDQTLQDRSESGRNTIEDFFDANYYLTNNPNVVAAIGRGEFANALDHFERVGKFEGRNPSVYYDEKVYLDYNPGVAAAVARGEFPTPFDHFIQDGQFEKRDPRLLLFDAQWYLFKNPDAKAAVANGSVKDGFTHYLNFGQFENRAPSILFDPNLYLQLNPSAAEAVRSGQFASAFAHYIGVGLHEGLTASVVFNNKDYLALYPDVAEAIARGQFQSGTAHFLRRGQYENRQPQLMIFNEGYYLENNSDVRAAVDAGTYKDGLEHFVVRGQFENRDPGPLFDTKFYAATYSDVVPAIANGLARSVYDHYRKFGRAEGRIHVPPERIVSQGLFNSTFVDDALSSTRDEFNADSGRFAS